MGVNDLATNIDVEEVNRLVQGFQLADEKGIEMSAPSAMNDPTGNSNGNQNLGNVGNMGGTDVLRFPQSGPMQVMTPVGSISNYGSTNAGFQNYNPPSPGTTGANNVINQNHHKSNTRRKSALKNRTIYDRLGGEPAISIAVDKFYEKVMADNRVNKYFKSIDMRKQHQMQ